MTHSADSNLIPDHLVCFSLSPSCTVRDSVMRLSWCHLAVDCVEDVVICFDLLYKPDGLLAYLTFFLQQVALGLCVYEGGSRRTPTASF